MKAVKMLGGKRLRIEDFPVPKAHDDWVVIKVNACALCGSDLNCFYRPSNEDAVNNNRLIPGHEIAGTVVETDKTQQLTVGQRVSVYPALGCGKCFFCSNNLWKACPKLQVVGFSLNGGHAEYLAVPERILLPVPDDISDETTALVWDAIGASYGAIKKLNIHSNDSVAVFGCGPIGLGAINTCKFLGATVIAIDPLKYRRDIAEKIGADFTINPEDSDIEEEIKKVSNEIGPDVCLECTGRGAVLHQALKSVRYGGKCGLIGELGVVKDVNFSREVIHRDLSIVGSFIYDHDKLDELLALVRHGLHVEKLITHKFSLADSEKAWALFDKGEAGKVVIYP